MSGTGRADDDIKFGCMLLALIIAIIVIIAIATVVDRATDPDVPRPPTPIVTQSGGRR